MSEHHVQSYLLIKILNNNVDYVEPEPTPQPSSRAASQRPIDKPVLDRLWTYCCPLTANRCVCAMGWNKSNKASRKLNVAVSQRFGLARVGYISRRVRTIRIYGSERRSRLLLVDKKSRGFFIIKTCMRKKNIN